MTPLSILSSIDARLPSHGPPASGGRPSGVTMNDLIPTTTPPSESGYVAPPGQVRATATAATLPALSRTALLARIGLLGVAAAAFIAAVTLVLGSSASPNGT